MTGQVAVKKYTRRRTGRAGQIAVEMGYDPVVKIDSYRRRHVTRAQRQPKEKPVSVGGMGLRGEQHFQRMYPNEAYVVSLDFRGPGALWVWEAYHHGLQFRSGFAETQKKAEREADRAVAQRQKEHQ